jgi:hypothetical protein
MKLKKHNYSATAAIVLYCFTSYKSFSYKRFTVLLVVITSLFSSYIYSQQPTFTGLENIHISEGATIIEKNLIKRSLPSLLMALKKLSILKKTIRIKKSLLQKGKIPLKTKLQKPLSKKS